MKERGFILTISTFMYVAIFILFLSLTAYMVFKPTVVDSQIIKPYLDYYKFNTGDASETNVDQYYWCSKFFYYDASNASSGYNGITEKTYCEGYNAKRFV